MDGPRRRTSMRYQGYDYAQPGAVFVTIATNGRQALFGEICDGHLVPSAAGSMAVTIWQRIPARFPTVEIDAYIVMPDHVHGVLFCGVTSTVPARTVGEVVRWFKSSVYGSYGTGVKRHGWPPYDGKLWQRDYYDRIIRDEQECERIRAYIAANPARWWEKHGNDHD